MSDVRWPWQRKEEMEPEPDPLLEITKAKQDQIAREQDRILVILARNEEEVQVLTRKGR